MVKNFFKSNIFWTIVFFAVIAFGIFVKTVCIINPPSFFSDECSLLLNIREKTFWEMFLPLGYNQCCPPLFLILAKIIYSMKNGNEQILRIIPYFPSILSVFAFVYLSFLVLKNKVPVLFATVVYIFSLPLLTYSWVFKHYSFDVLASILVLTFAVLLKNKSLTYGKIAVLSLLSVLSVMFSFTSAFIIFTSFLTLFFFKYFQAKSDENEVKILVKKCAVFVVPAGVLMSVYFLITCLPAIKSSALQSYWSGFSGGREIFCPVTVPDFKNIFVFFTGGDFTGAYFVNFLPMFLLFGFSLVYCFKKDKFLFSLLVMPFVLAFINAILRLYPFAPERVSLYLSPILIILTAYGLKNFCLNAKTSFTSFLLLFCLFFNYKSMHIFFENFFKNKEQLRFSFTKEFVQKIYKSDYKKEDYILGDYASYNCFDCYDTENKINKTNVIYPENEMAKELQALEKLPSGSVIFFYYSEKYHFWYASDLKNWVSKNCETKSSSTDRFATFVKCKKY